MTVFLPPDNSWDPLVDRIYHPVTPEGLRAGAEGLGGSMPFFDSSHVVCS